MGMMEYTNWPVERAQIEFFRAGQIIYVNLKNVEQLVFSEEPHQPHLLL